MRSDRTGQSNLTKPVPRGESGPPFVGRDEQLELFESCLLEAVAGRPRVVLVRGEAGVGKTRLLKEVGRRAHRRGLQVCYGRWYEDMVLPYLPFVEPLRALFARMPEDVQGRLGTDAEAVTLFLRDGVAAMPADPVTSPEAGQYAVRLFLALSRATITQVQRHPAVLIFDDVHWADRSSLDLLAHLVFAVADAAVRDAVPLLIVAGHRAVEAEHRLARLLARFEREEICRTVELHGLTELDVDRLIRGIGVERPSHQLVAAVSAATAGNPLFVQELVHHLSSRGALQERGGFLVTTMTPDDVGVPPELRDALTSRIRGLSEQCRRLLTLASCLGERCSVATLRAASGQGTVPLPGLLQEAIRERLLVAEGQIVEFSHPLIRHILYTEPDEARRRDIHLEIARALEHTGVAGSGAHDLEVAHHLVRAGSAADPDTVAVRARRAADHAVSILAWADAARFYEAALLAAERAGHLSAEGRAELHYLAGHARYRDLDRGPCLDHYEKATLGYREAGDIGGLARALAEQTRARLILGGVSLGTLIDLEPLRNALRALGDRQPGLGGRIRAIISTAYWTARQPLEAQEMARSALETGANLKDDTLCAYASFALGQAHFERLDVAPALVAFQAALRYGRRTNDLWLQGWPLQRLPLIFLSLGRLDEAETVALQASKLARESHDWSNYSLTQALLASLAVARGNLRAAEVYCSESLTLARRSHYPWGGVAALLARAHANWLRGAWGEAEAALDLLLEPGHIFDEPGPSLRAIAERYRRLVRIHAAGPPPEGTPPPHSDSRPTAGPIDLFSLGSVCALVEIADLQGVREPIDDLYRALSEVSARSVVFSMGWLAFVPRVLGIAARLGGRPEEADAHFQEAIALAERGRALTELGRACLDRARFLATRSERDDVPRALELARRAAAIFGETGMEPFARRAQGLAARLEVFTAPPQRGEAAASAAARPPIPKPPPAPTHPLVIAVTDMTGSTELLQRLGDAGAQRLLHIHNDLVRACLREHGGAELQHTGDGFLASFASALSAIDCAVAIQLAFARYTDDNPATPLRVRVGLHAGEALPEEGRLYGTAVYATFRVCGRARPGEVLVSEVVRQLVAGKGFAFRYRGRFALKGFSDRFRLYAVEWPLRPDAPPELGGSGASP